MSFAWKLAQVSEGRRGGTGARQRYARLGTNHGRVEWRERRLQGTPLFFFGGFFFFPLTYMRRLLASAAARGVNLSEPVGPEEIP